MKRVFSIILILLMLVNGVHVFSISENILNVASQFHNELARVTSASHPETGLLNINDGDDTTVISLEKGESPIHIFIDLGEAYDISTITLEAAPNTAVDIQGVNIYGSNDPKCENANWREVADLCIIKDFGNDVLTISPGESVEFELDKLKQRSFRYVIISKEYPKENGDLTLAEVEINAYASSKSGGYVVGLEPEYSNTKINAEFLKHTGIDGSTLIAAKYDKNSNALLDVRTFDVNNTSVNNNIENFCDVMSLIGDNDGTYRYKFFLWESLDNCRPIYDSSESVITFKENEVFAEYWVSPDGNDGNSGSKTEPFKTIKAAQEAVKQISSGMTGDIYVNIEPGTYYADDIIRFKQENSGKNGYKVVYRGIDMPVISAGKEIGTFSQGADGLWQITGLDELEDITELYVGNTKAIVAHSNNLYLADDVYVNGSTKEGLYIKKSCFENIPKDCIVGTDLYFYAGFTYTRFGIDSVEEDSEDTERYIVKFVKPFAKYMNDSASHLAKLTDHFTLANAKELLDEPGEFYFDKGEKTLYYMPKDDDCISLKAVVPSSEMLVTISGEGASNKVENISFEGLCFAHTKDATLDSDYFTARQQTNVGDNAQGVKHNAATLTSAVEINHADNIKFEGCIFSNLGLIGINMLHGVENADISNCAFFDIGNSAISVGHVTHGDDTLEEVAVIPPQTAMLDLTANAVVKTTGDLRNVAMRHDYLYKDAVYKHTNGKDLSNNAYGAQLFITEDEFDYTPTTSNIWKSNDVGEQYIIFDFLDYYTIDKIKVYFGSANEAEYRNDYDILLSNDPTFKENTMVYSYKKGDGNKISIDVDDGGKYRYGMIRSNNPDKPQFYMARIAFLSDDVEPYVNLARCKNIRIANNYITRVGIGNGIAGNGTAVSSYGFEENITIVNNEIYDMPYSAIGIGYGWCYDYKGSRNHYIANNYIHKTNQILNDGAAIYTLSCQDGTIVENNYIENTGVGRGLYPDQGSGGILFRNNVVLDTTHAFFSNGVENLEAVNTYSTTNMTRKSGNYYIDGFHGEMYGAISQAAQKIKAAAGVDGRYNQLESYIVNESKPIFTEDKIMSLDYVKTYSGIKNTLLDSIEIILKNGTEVYDNNVINELNRYKIDIESGCDEVKLAEIRYYLRQLGK